MGRLLGDAETFSADREGVVKKGSFLRQGAVRGFLHEPVEPARAGLVLTHGAGGRCESPLVIAMGEAFCASGFLVLRCDLPFRQKRPYGPPAPANGPEDRAGLAEAVSVIRKSFSGPLFLGGHSYGARQASILATEQEGSADVLLLLSYPLHPPAKPDQLRTAHWPELRTPCFFVHGSTDPFGSIDDMRTALPLIPAPTSLVAMEGAGHDLHNGRFDIEQSIVAPAQAFGLALQTAE